ncbi:MAG TPA: UDP-N-acetylglucosamine 2-epimerase [Planctomycetaceae bacterium]|nr:UDP-N-acetylglucosamine 2-epimerase [Planctomycetaceae bacterium]
MKTITVVTGARSDYGLLKPLLTRVAATAGLRIDVMVTGMHLAPEFGLTVREIERDGFPIRDRIECLTASDTPQAIAQSMGLGQIGFAQAFARSRPELLVILGDRTEMLAAATAALPFRIPIAHIHGGELTQGAIDDAVRHCLTKLCHLHFVALPEFADRVHQLGETWDRIHVVGAMGLDAIRQTPRLSNAEFAERFGTSLTESPIVVTFHPVTQEFDRTEWQIDELLAALSKTDGPLVFTYPNSDTNGRIIINRIQRFVSQYPLAKVVQNLGSAGYFTLMSHARAMVGNSSSGILEAASFRLPVVNIGTRQQGRPQPANVIQTDYDRNSIGVALRRAVSEPFIENLCDLQNPYGDGRAAERIVEVLNALPDADALVRKGFHDQPRLAA